MVNLLRTYPHRIISNVLSKNVELLQVATADLEKELLLFLNLVIDSLTTATEPSEELRQRTFRQGHQLHRLSVPLAQVVHLYGDVCQAMTELANELNVAISPSEYHAFNQCLDEGIAAAVTGYTEASEQAGAQSERVGVLAHEMRNAINTGLLAFDVLKRGQIGVSGSTGAVLHRSLMNLHQMVEREFTRIRLQPGRQSQQQVRVAEFIRDIAAEAQVQASARSRRLSVPPIDPELTVSADRQLLTSALTNLLQNALKFSHEQGLVSVRVSATAENILIEVEDECGGLPTDKIEELFRPFEQQGADRSGLGLGLSISRQAVHACGGELRATDLPGKGCIFIIELPRSASS